eukprot:sb/3472548/
MSRAGWCDPRIDNGFVVPNCPKSCGTCQEETVETFLISECLVPPPSYHCTNNNYQYTSLLVSYKTLNPPLRTGPSARCGYVRLPERVAPREASAHTLQLVSPLSLCISLTLLRKPSYGFPRHHKSLFYSYGTESVLEKYTTYEVESGGGGGEGEGANDDQSQQH